MKTIDNAYLHVGLDFTSPESGRVTCIQLVDRSRGAIAIADFKDGSLTRIKCLPEIDRAQFEKDSRELLGNSIPVQFLETKLP